MDRASDDTLGNFAALATANLHEAGLAYFIESNWRPRFRESLESEKRREKLLHKFNHFRHLDARFAERVPREHQRGAFLLAALKKQGAPQTCYLMSDDSDLDGLEMPLTDALRLVLEGEIGTFISCLPGRLAYFHDEEEGNRFILSRCD